LVFNLPAAEADMPVAYCGFGTTRDKIYPSTQKNKDFKAFDYDVNC
jgi:hypothetical protein